MTMSGAGRRWTVRPASVRADDDRESAGGGFSLRQIPGRLWPRLLTVNSLFYREAARTKAKNGQFCSAEGLALVF